MTENKRFKNNGSMVFDNKKPMNTIEVVECLNNLHEENKQLKCDLKTLQLQDEDRKAYQRTLETENKELKSTIERYKMMMR